MLGDYQLAQRITSTLSLINWMSDERELGSQTEPWQNKHLFVTHWQHTGTGKYNYHFCDGKRAIYELPDMHDDGDYLYWMWSEYFYELPNIIKIFAGDHGAQYSDYPYPDNTDVGYEINQGYAIVNYNGHGSYKGWHDWYIDDGPDWTGVNVSLLSNDIYPVVFNLGCSLGWLGCPSDYCLCEWWLNVPNRGAVGAVGSTPGQYADTQDIFDQRLYRVMFDRRADCQPLYPENEIIFGPLLNTTKIMCYGYWSYQYEYDQYQAWKHWEVRAFECFGDPSMKIRLLIDEVDSNLKTFNNENLNNHSIVEIDNIYPNPVLSNIMNIGITSNKSNTIIISIYDISGRKVLNNVIDVEEGNTLIDVDISSLTSGVYVLKVNNTENYSSAINNINVTKKFVVVK
jgi:hypothetical protein